MFDAGYRFPGERLEDKSGSVGTRGGNIPAVGTPGDGGHAQLMLQPGYFAAARHRINAYKIVVPAHAKIVSIRAESHRLLVLELNCGRQFSRSHLEDARNSRPSSP